MAKVCQQFISKQTQTKEARKEGRKEGRKEHTKLGKAQHTANSNDAGTAYPVSKQPGNKRHIFVPTVFMGNLPLRPFTEPMKKLP